MREREGGEREIEREYEKGRGGGRDGNAATVRPCRPPLLAAAGWHGPSRHAAYITTAMTETHSKREREREGRGREGGNLREGGRRIAREGERETTERKREGVGEERRMESE